MLERFHVPEELAVRVSPEIMRSTVERILVALGMPEADAAQSADVLIYADVRGIDSHGVSNMFRSYVQAIRDGRINLHPKWRIIRDAPAACTIDSDGAHGGVIGPEGMRIAIERARAHGIGAVTVANGGHFGAAAYHAAMALEHDMIGIAMTAGGIGVVPTGGSERIIGLNPIAVAVPTRHEAPFIFDASMSSVAGNKVRLLQRLGRPVAPGWIADPDGTPIMDERPIPEGFMILPLGGTREVGSHKGYGLSIVVEMLTSALAGAGAGPGRRQGQAHHFLAYDVTQFTDIDAFKDDTDAYLRRLRESKPAPGEERVYYAGLPEHEEEARRRELGVPYHPEVIAWFKETLEELRLEDRLP